MENLEPIADEAKGCDRGGGQTAQRWNSCASITWVRRVMHYQPAQGSGQAKPQRSGREAGARINVVKQEYAGADRRAQDRELESAAVAQTSWHGRDHRCHPARSRPVHRGHPPGDPHPIERIEDFFSSPSASMSSRVRKSRMTTTTSRRSIFPRTIPPGPCTTPFTWTRAPCCAPTPHRCRFG